ncbi:hypothetical protein D915_006638 [Fasciola hepatica]|uniref:Uncharacterized protein n=1 Tax=Fasciola hepatica TaxID=6192 RepID=A0A4E0R6U1_FASHE|nr:hypothetical protein D915_006638 [Fasciola hepatica]
MSPELVDDDNKPEEIISTLRHTPFEPVWEECQKDNTIADEIDNKKSNENDNEAEIEFHEQYMGKLWGSDAVSYFFHPVFHRSNRASARRRQTLVSDETTEPLILGGYPTGMLQGARIPFKMDLSPWILEPIDCGSSSDLSLSSVRRDSSSRRWSTMSLASTVLSTSAPRRPSSVFTLLDVLRLHTGGNPGARRVWEFLRTKSNDLLTKKQEELDADGRDTYSAFTRETVLKGNLKPPLCDFVRSNPSANLAITMTKLKAPRMEKQFRQIQAMAKWAERNQAQFCTMAYQHDLRDMLTDTELAELMREYRGQQRRTPDTTEQWKPISQAQADQLRERLPPLEQRKRLGPLETPRPSIGSLLPSEATANKRLPKSHSPTVRLESNSGQNSRELRMKPRSQVVYLQDFRKRQRRGLTQTKPVEFKRTMQAGQSVSLTKSPGQLLLQYTEKVSPTPLCWSQLIQQYADMKDDLSGTGSYEAAVDPNSYNGDGRICHQYVSSKSDVKGMWKPPTAIPQ